MGFRCAGYFGLIFVIFTFSPQVPDDFKEQIKHLRSVSNTISARLGTLDAIMSKSNTDLAKECGISESQKVRVQKILKKYNLLDTDLALDDLPLSKQINAKEKILQELDELMKDVFLDHQIRRLQQISLQLRKIRKQSEGFDCPLLFAEEIGLNETEKRNLEKIIQQKRAEFYLENEKLLRDSRRKIERVIPLELRKSLKIEFGDPLDFDQFDGLIKKKKKTS